MISSAHLRSAPFAFLDRPSHRSIQALAEGRDPGDLTTMEDPAALQQVKDLVTR